MTDPATLARLRRTIALVGGSLPVTLALGGVATGLGLLPSMSATYYSPLREVFTGTLCANAALYWLHGGLVGPGAGRWASRIAGLSGAAIALVPMLPADGTCHAVTQCVLGTAPAATLHFGAAALHFATLALISLLLFARDADGPGARRLHRACGWIIIAALAALGLLGHLPLPWRNDLAPLRPVYLLEAVAVFAFAVSWLVKARLPVR